MVYVLLLFFVRTLVIAVVLVSFEKVCSLPLPLYVPREGCASCLWHILGMAIFTYFPKGIFPILFLGLFIIHLLSEHFSPFLNSLKLLSLETLQPFSTAIHLESQQK